MEIAGLHQPWFSYIWMIQIQFHNSWSEDKTLCNINIYKIKINAFKIKLLNELSG